MRRSIFWLLLLFILGACAPLQFSMEQPASQPPPVLTTPSPEVPALPTGAQGTSELSRTDEQGAVVFVATPLNLDTPADTLEFDVTMNTHSVDLSMDLAALSRLSTDTGITVQAIKWDAIPGGHHVQGTLIFPAMQDGKSILEGAGTLTLTIANVDAASRIFEWKLE